MTDTSKRPDAEPVCGEWYSENHAVVTEHNERLVCGTHMQAVKVSCAHNAAIRQPGRG